MLIPLSTIVFSFVGCTILDVIIIIVYYCQDVQLFHKANNKSPFSGDDTNDHNDVVTSIISLFTRFNWEIFAWATDFCALKGVTAVKNQVVATFFAPTIITLLCVVCLIWHFVAQRKENTKIFKSEMKSELISQFLWYTLFLTLLLTYQGHLIETAALLKCVPFSDSKVLFLNGNICLHATLAICRCLVPWVLVVTILVNSCVWLTSTSERISISTKTHSAVFPSASFWLIPDNPWQWSEEFRAQRGLGLKTNQI